MNDLQLKVWANMIVKAMKEGAMDKVTELYGKVSETASMEDAARLEALIAEGMGS